MKTKLFRRFTATALAMIFMTALPLTASADTNTYANGGAFTDKNTLTWTANDGTVTTYGRGPVFSDVHPDITDPEYYLKGYYEQEGGSWDAPYHRDSSTYNDALAQELKAFVHSFDWIHSDELTRATMVHDRIANGHYGNVYASAENISGFPLLMKGKGQCGDFSGEFKYLAKFVGLECETYAPFYMHQACLIKISGQWFATDPTGASPFLSNAKTHPVDYETEVNRYAKEAEAEREKSYIENPDSWATRIDMMDRQLMAGEITEAQYDEMYTALIAEK